MGDNLENYLQSYFKSIFYLQDENDIRKALPNTDFRSFYEIINGLLGMISKEIAELENCIVEENNLKYKEELKEDLKNWKFKQGLCMSLLEEAEKIEEDESSLYNSINKDLVFASTVGGGTMFERDLKSIPEEYYSSVITCLERLKKGNIDSNDEKEKAFTNNGCLQGLHEEKEFKIRIIYRVLSKDVLYVMMVKTKKSDNDKADVLGPINRKKNTQDEFYELQSMLNDNQKKEQIIRKSEEDYGRIVTILNAAKRGKNRG